MEKDATLRVVLDVVLLCLSPIPSLVFKVAVSPFKRGFFCDDESISHPYKEDTIPLWIVIVIGITVPIILMIPIELWRYRYQSKRRGMSADGDQLLVCKRAVHPYLVIIYKAVGAFLFAVAVCQVSTDIIKYSIGRLRPHFLDVCKPNYTAFSCQDVHNNYLYIEADVCTGDPHHLKEARLSHPSGHSSMSMLCAVYFVLYLQSRFKWRGSRLLRHFVQAVVLYCAIYVCSSRVSDYKHHWSDVLGGGILGTVVALTVAFYVSDLFVRPKLRDIAGKINELHAHYTSDSGRDGYGTNDAASNELHQVTQSTSHQSVDMTGKDAPIEHHNHTMKQEQELPTNRKGPTHF